MSKNKQARPASNFQQILLSYLLSLFLVGVALALVLDELPSAGPAISKMRSSRVPMPPRSMNPCARTTRATALLPVFPPR